MERILAIIILSICLGLTACQSNDVEVPLETVKEMETEEGMESLANEEYDSLDDFLASNKESVFALNPAQISRNTASASNATALSAVDTNVSVSESYIAVTYDCEAGVDAFQVKLLTYTLANGKRQLESVLNSNPGVFTEKEIEGISMYYCQGTEYDWFNCYAMVLDNKMFVINIDKNYDKYIGDVVSNIILQ